MNICPHCIYLFDGRYGQVHICLDHERDEWQSPGWMVLMGAPQATCHSALRFLSMEVFSGRWMVENSDIYREAVLVASTRRIIDKTLADATLSGVQP